MVILDCEGDGFQKFINLQESLRTYHPLQHPPHENTSLGVLYSPKQPLICFGEIFGEIVERFFNTGIRIAFAE
jgi:hypothetical protein